jgi:hypothetical protein
VAGPAHRPVLDLDPGLLHALEDDFHRALSVIFRTVFLSLLKIADRILSSERPIGNFVSPCSG